MRGVPYRFRIAPVASFSAMVRFCAPVPAAAFAPGDLGMRPSKTSPGGSRGAQFCRHKKRDGKYFAVTKRLAKTVTAKEKTHISARNAV